MCHVPDSNVFYFFTHATVNTAKCRTRNEKVQGVEKKNATGKVLKYSFRHIRALMCDLKISIFLFLPAFLLYDISSLFYNYKI